MELRIAICDDMHSHLLNIEKTTRDTLDGILGDEYYNKSVISCYSFSDTDSLLKSITDGNREYNLLISDIQMPENDRSGIELAKTVNDFLPDCRIIFVTGYPDYAMDVYETNHIYLVLKNRLDEGLPIALEKAIKSLFKDNGNKIAIQGANGTVVLKTNDIIYLEREGRNTKIVIGKETFLSKQNLNEIEPLLPSTQFAKCHNSFIVNLDKVKVYRTNSVETENGKEISISRKYKDKFNDSFFMNIVAKSLSEREK